MKPLRNCPYCGKREQRDPTGLFTTFSPSLKCCLDCVVKIMNEPPILPSQPEDTPA